MLDSESRGTHTPMSTATFRVCFIFVISPLLGCGVARAAAYRGGKPDVQLMVYPLRAYTPDGIECLTARGIRPEYPDSSESSRSVLFPLFLACFSCRNFLSPRSPDDCSSRSYFCFILCTMTLHPHTLLCVSFYFLFLFSMHTSASLA
jgi:hypothetical protein